MKTYTKTADNIRQLLDHDPHRTLEELAALVGVTRERVRQICVKHNFHRVSPYEGRVKHYQRKCADCSKAITWRNESGRCRDCRRTHYRATANTYVNLICTECGTIFERRRAEAVVSLRRNPDIKFVCSKSCFGARAGRDFGFGAHPENAGSPRQTHCKRGHLFDEANTYTFGNGRQCRACHLMRAKRNRASYHRRKAQATP